MNPDILAQLERVVAASEGRVTKDILSEGWVQVTVVVFGAHVKMPHSVVVTFDPEGGARAEYQRIEGGEPLSDVMFRHPNGHFLALNEVMRWTIIGLAISAEWDAARMLQALEGVSEPPVAEKE